MSAPSKDNDVKSAPHSSMGMAEAFQPKGEILPERPSMRSVGIMTKGPSLIGPGMGAGPPSGLSFGPPPRLGLSKPTPLGKLARPSVGLGGGGGATFGMKQEIFATSTAAASSAPAAPWNVTFQDLEAVPEYCPLERTHRIIKDAKASVVATRISDCLRQHSIDAEYHPPPHGSKNGETGGGGGGPRMAKCQTNDPFVRFRIRLYTGRDGDDTESQQQPVIVEVQRRSGSASSFMRTCRAILNAAEGKEASPGPPSSSGPFGGSNRMGIPPPLKPIGQMSFMKSMPAHPPPNMMKMTKAKSVVRDVDAGSTTAALDRALEMIRSDQRDTNILGLENLVALTDPIKTSPTVAMHVSKCFLGLADSSSMDDSKYDGVREEIRLLTEHDVFDAATEGEGMKNHADQIRSMALSVFENTLELCGKESNNTSSSIKWFQESLLPTLVDEVNRAETGSACNACTAASCIHSLLTSSMGGSSRVVVADQGQVQALVNCGGVDALRRANKFGILRHELLANETSRCLSLLNE